MPIPLAPSAHDILVRVCMKGLYIFNKKEEQATSTRIQLCKLIILLVAKHRVIVGTGGFVTYLNERQS